MDPIDGIVAGIAALLGIGGAVLYGVDQHQKRTHEQAANRANSQEWKRNVTTLEAKFRTLSTALGEKNNQVRTLAAEVVQLRNEIAARAMSA